MKILGYSLIVASLIIGAMTHFIPIDMTWNPMVLGAWFLFLLGIKVLIDDQEARK